jgi:hypothetical protein
MTIIFTFIVGSAKAASSSLSSDTTAKAGDTLYVTMSFTGSNTVAVGVIYSYNSCISSVSASNASPWGNSQSDSSQNQIGVGDYNGYESGSWNYILNGTTQVITFKINIASDAVAGDVAILKLDTVYYATTSNTLEEVTARNLPTAGTSSISITIVDDTDQSENPTDVPVATVTPSDNLPSDTTLTPSPDDEGDLNITLTPTPDNNSETALTPTPDNNSETVLTPTPDNNSETVLTPTPDNEQIPTPSLDGSNGDGQMTPAPSGDDSSFTTDITAEPTQSSSSSESNNTSQGSSSDFLDTSPIIPGELFESIDDDYFDSSTGGYVVAATKDDRGKTTVYEVVTNENNDANYIKKVINNNGDVTEEVISEEQMNSEMNSLDNYLADKENKNTYEEVTSEYADSDSVATASDEDGKVDAKSVPYGTLFAVVFGIIIIFAIIFFLVIRKFKEHSHTFNK